MKKEQITQEIETQTRSWLQAEASGARELLEQMLSDDFLGVGPLGFLLSKEDWIERHRSGDLRYTSLELTETSVRVYPGTALLVGRLSQEISYRGNPIEGQFRMTLTWVWLQERWQLVDYHISALGQPPTFRNV